jgi:hypothetical protein
LIDRARRREKRERREREEREEGGEREGNERLRFEDSAKNRTPTQTHSYESFAGK